MKVKAWEIAKQWQEENDSTATFEELLGWHLSHGLVHASPQVLLLASEVRWNAEEGRFESGEPNCWFVRLAASAGHTNPVGEFMRVAPRPQQYAAWCRRGGFEPRIYDWNKLLRKTRG
jgi:hypothetical protein